MASVNVKYTFAIILRKDAFPEHEATAAEVTVHFNSEDSESQLVVLHKSAQDAAQDAVYSGSLVTAKSNTIRDVEYRVDGAKISTNAQVLGTVDLLTEAKTSSDSLPEGILAVVTSVVELSANEVQEGDVQAQTSTTGPKESLEILSLDDSAGSSCEDLSLSEIQDIVPTSNPDNEQPKETVNASDDIKPAQQESVNDAATEVHADEWKIIVAPEAVQADIPEVAKEITASTEVAVVEKTDGTPKDVEDVALDEAVVLKADKKIANPEAAEEKTFATPETVVEVVATPEAVVEEAVAAPEAVVEEAVAAPEAVVEEVVAAPEAVVEEAVAAPEAVVEEVVAAPEAVVEEVVAAPEAVVEEAVAAPEAVVEEVVAAPEAVVEEAVATPEAVVEEVVAAPEAVVEEVVAAPEAVVEEVVAAPEAVVEEAVAAPEAVVEEVVAAPEAVVEEVVATREVIEEAVAAPEAVVEEAVATPEAVVEEVVAAPEAVVEE
ncbi:hypothetical protein LPJ66_011037, partial [Kickxella alabastrina]